MNQREILKEYFGYENFRQGQTQLIDSILNRKDVLGIMPTGAGKSICFQVPALMLSGITLVVSPLISLMKDQVNALVQAGIKAAFINSSLSESQISRALSGAKNGEYKLIYVAPERLLSYEFLSFAQDANISMVTVDEAHCISQWGQDFRPSYAKIPEFVGALPVRPIVSAFTATATKKVKNDIIELLQLNCPEILITGFNRENLYFEVQTPKNKFMALLDYLKARQDKSGIIYCSTRKTVEEVWENLNDANYNAAKYHAGLTSQQRHSSQEDFLFDRAQIMVATNAFGMGIDKSNVSYVVHYNMPRDIESYYQEAGRAGRDGEEAECVLFYSGQDVRTQQWLIENSNERQELEEEQREFLKALERNRLKEMTFYCTTSDCLRHYILKYFGETPPSFCGKCSNCNTNFETEDVTVEAQKIMSCIIRTKSRYGINMVIDVLRGSKNERIMSFGLNEISTYGISQKSTKQLREIFNYLIFNEYLIKTEDEYPRIEVSQKSADVLKGKEKIIIKLQKEPKVKVSIKAKAAYGEADAGLYETLRKLRHEVANSENVPAFVVFSNATLTDMCVKKPKNREEMLNVDGVGKVKYEKYGEDFLKAILEFEE